MSGQPRNRKIDALIKAVDLDLYQLEKMLGEEKQKKQMTVLRKDLLSLVTYTRNLQREVQRQAFAIQRLKKGKSE